MEKSAVYFTNLRTTPNNNLLDKLQTLVYKAGIKNIDFENKFTAIKLNFGEPGNLAYIRHNYIKKTVEIIKSLKGIPFLTDSNTLYLGKRSNAVDHINTAHENGFSPISVGCNVIIADGLKGTEYKEIEINGKHCKTAKIGTAIAHADIIISLNHFKGHEMAGFGGAIKNLGMGSGSKAGKLEMHSQSKPRMSKKNCKSCAQCIRNCAQHAIDFDADKKAEIDYEKCTGCGQCVAVCLFRSANVNWDETENTINEKIAEYALAVVKDKPCFHINFIMNVSPNCDCWSSNDAAIVPDIGILASFDPVALDMASVDLVNKADAVKNSPLGDIISHEHMKCNEHFDKFGHIHPGTNWASGIKHGECIGLGSSKYTLIEV